MRFIVVNRIQGIDVEDVQPSYFLVAMASVRRTTMRDFSPYRVNRR